VQIGGQDYLVPIDAELAREVDVDDETVALDRAIRAVSGANKLRLVIIDACRDNPFRAWSGAKGVTRGLAAGERPRARFDADRLRRESGLPEPAEMRSVALKRAVNLT